MKTKSLFVYSILFIAFILCVAFCVLLTHGVSTNITEEDKTYINLTLKDAGYAPETLAETKDFTQEIKTITAIQNSAFHTAPQTGLIPKGTPREPKNLYESTDAYCSDRARFIDKALRLYGFNTRYASLYKNPADKNFFQVMTTRTKQGTKSHALIEVQTSKGWLVIDTRTHWISLDDQNNPVSLKALQEDARTGIWPKWSKVSNEGMYELLHEPFYILYGFYSRHGLFYPPYTSNIPDIDYSQFFLNFAI